jgi:hypothetical protein
VCVCVWWGAGGGGVFLNWAEGLFFYVGRIG